MLLGVFAVYLFLQFRIPSLTQFSIVARIETISSKSWSFTSINMFNNSTTSATQPMCTYSNNVSIYMDDLKVVSKYFLFDYPQYVERSHQCGPLPGGGHCLFNTNNSTSDAIFYCASHTKLKFKRMFDEQIVVIFTRESENGKYCHFPPRDKYDIKVSYRRNSTISVPFFCDENLLLRLVEMGQPDVPVGRENLVAGVMSNCEFEWRTKYITELMEHIHIDQWGKCLKNTPGDFWKNRRARSFEQQKLDFLTENPYKFLMAFENTVEVDYITEKIYDSYLTRTIPIYFGDKAVFDFIPTNTSLIYANNYTPKELAKLIKHIGTNDTLYSEFFKNWDLVKMRNLHEQYCSEHFICTICREVWKKLYKGKCGDNSISNN